MSANDLYLMHLKDFESNISKRWKVLQKDVDFCDVTLACDDEQIKVHKVVISTCSPILKNLLKKNPHQHPLLYLRGVKFTELVNIVNFMYQGEVKIPKDEINGLLDVAKDLQVLGLSESNDDVVVDLAEPCDNTKNEQKKKIIVVESYDDRNTVERKRKISKKEPSAKNEPVDVDLNKYILDYGYQSRNDHFESKVMIQEDYNEGLNQTREDYNEDQIENINYVKSESLICDSAPEEEDENSDKDNYTKNSLTCEQCNTTFKQSSNLHVHIKSFHEGLRFSCDKCDYTATQTGALNRHTKSIHDKIRYPCNLCDFSATQKAMLNKHLKVKH